MSFIIQMPGFFVTAFLILLAAARPHYGGALRLESAIGEGTTVTAAFPPNRTITYGTESPHRAAGKQRP